VAFLSHTEPIATNKGVIGCHPDPMARLLDFLALLMLLLAAASMCAGVYVMGNRDDIAAFFFLASGFVFLRSAVDLLRPRTVG